MTAFVALFFFGLAWIYGFYIGGWDDLCARLQNVGLMWLAVRLITTNKEANK